MNRTHSARTLGLLFTAAMLWSSTAAARVEVAGGINVDTVWRAADSPYVVTGELAVRPGATLTIEPGTEIHVGANLQFVVEGRLVAHGLPQSPILFRGVAETSGTWARITLAQGGDLSIRHAEIRHATHGLYVNNVVPQNLVLEDTRFTGYRTAGVHLNSAGGPYTLTRVSADGRGTAGMPSYGIYASTTQITLDGGVIRNNANGVYVRDRSATITRVVFDQNTYGVYGYQNLNATSTIDIERSTFRRQTTASIFGVRGRSGNYRLNIGAARSIFDGEPLVFSNGDIDYPFVITTFRQNVYTAPALTNNNLVLPGDQGTSLRYAALLANPDNGDYQPTDRSPARYFEPQNPAGVAGAIDFQGALTGEGLHGFWYENRVFAPETVYDVAGDIVVAPGVTVNFRPGATFRIAPQTDLMTGGLNPNRIEIRVEGTLEADGTNSRPVRFESGAAEPRPADWYGIVIPAEAEAFNVAQVVIGHAYRGVSLYENDHIVAGSRIHHSDNAGIYIEGGTPQIEEVTIEDGLRVGIDVRNRASVPITQAIVRRNGGRGIQVDDSSIDVSDSRIHDNTDGIYAYNDINQIATITLDHVTVAHNSGSGISASRGRSGTYRLNLTLNSTSVTHNVSNGVTTADVDYPAAFSCSGTNVWGNGRDYLALTPVGSCFSYNPLYADIAQRNYEPTRWSPNRGLGVGGSHVGMLPWVDAIGPQIMGYLWENITFTRQESPYTMLGDIVVPPGVTVTFEPGAEIRVLDREDQMLGGLSTNRAELRIQDGATAIFGTPVADQPAQGIAGQRVLFRSTAEQPAGGAWYGMHFEAGGTSSLYNVEIRHPTYGIYAIGPTAPRVRYVRVMHHSNTGLYFQAITGAPRIDVHGAFVVGPRRGTGQGLYIENGDGVITSSYFTHHSYGARIQNSGTQRTPAVTLTNNTFVKHSTGIYLVRGRSNSYGLTMRLYNNVIADNTSFAISDGQWPDYPANTTVVNNDYFGVNTTVGNFTTNRGNITTDPRVEDIDWDDVPRWWDGQLWPESLAINAGDAAAVSLPQTDILGRPRVMGGRVDIGAWEHDPDANVEPRADGVTASIMVPRGEVFTFDGSAAFDPDGRIASAFWTMSDGTVTAGQSVQHTFANEGQNQWGYITVVDDDGAEDHARVLVNVNVRPIADAGPDVFQDEGPAESVFFDGTLSRDPDGNIVRWEWDFGDGSPTTTAQSPRHSYLSAGLYTVTLTVTDDEGLTDTDTTIATVFGNLDIVGPLVEHNELADGLPVGQPVEIRATIRDPGGVQDAVLFYRTIGEGAARFLLMQPAGGNIYSATIPANHVNAPGVQYWIVARDGVEPEPNTSTWPVGAPAQDVWDFLVVGDRDPPVIVHAPVANGQAPGEAVTVSATLQDATGIGSAVLFFRSQGSQVFGATNMARVNGDVWAAQIPAFVVGEAGVEYYIAAQDSSPIPNTATSPAGAPGALYRFSVESADRLPPVIVHQPVQNGQTEGLPVTVTAGIVDADGQIETAEIAWRAVGAPAFQRAPMARVDGNTWRGQIPGAGVVLAGVQYYIEAVDQAGNRATDPAQAPVVSHLFSVTAEDRIGPVLEHVRIADGQPENEDVFIEATAEDPSGVVDVRVYYRPQGFPFFQNAQLVLADGVWTGAIPGFAVQPPAIEYYLRATDGEGNLGYAPQAAPGAPYTFRIGSADEVGPVLVHDPIADGRPTGQPVAINVAAIDDAGVESVIVNYRRQGAPDFVALPLVRGQNSQWTGTLPGAAMVVGTIEYHIVATDRSQNQNQTRLPAQAGAEYRFTVTAPDQTGPAIVHAPAAAPLAPGRPFVVTATVTDPSGVGTVTLRWAIDDGLYRSREMTPGAAPGAYTATIAPEFIPAGAAEIRYAITAVDTLGNSATVPAGGEQAPFVQPLEQLDVDPPLVEVALDGVAPPVVAGAAVPLEITALDDRAVVLVTVEVLAGGDLVAEIVAAPGADDTWTATIPQNRVIVPGLSVVAVATDAAGNEGRSEPLAIAVVPPPDLTPPEVTLARVPDGQLAGQPVTVTAQATDGVGVTGATLYYRRPPAVQYRVQVMNLGPADTWRAQIPGGEVAEPAVEYYVEARDAAGNTATDPDVDAATPARFTVSPVDRVGPVCGHFTQVVWDRATPLPLAITADDPSGVDAVRVFWRNDGEANDRLLVAAPAGDGYAAVIPNPQPPAVQYYIEADDRVGNTSRCPAQGLYRVTVVEPDVQGPVIEHAPPADAAPGEALLIGAIITDPSGVASAELRYRTIGGAVFGALPLVAGADASYAATIPAVAVNAPGIEYYLAATDAEGNTTRHPAGDATHRVAVGGGDVEPPLVVHEAIRGPVPAGQPIDIEALAEDDSGVAGLTVYFRVAGAGPWLSAELALAAGTWTARIPGAVVAPPAIEYYLAATDLAGNRGFNPAAGPAAPIRVDVQGAPADVTPPRITLTPAPDGAPVGVGVTVAATITDDGLIAAATLHARVEGTVDFIAIPMNPDADRYTARIPAALVQLPGVEYYVEARDAAGNTARAPAGAPAAPLGFSVVDPNADDTPPAIRHSEVEDRVITGAVVPIQATVTDAGSGVARVTLHFRTVGGGAYISAAMARNGDTYTGTILDFAVRAPGVQYYIEAADAAGNVAYAPAAGADAPYLFGVDDPQDLEAPVVVHTPPEGPLLAGAPIRIEATVTDAALDRVQLRYRTRGDAEFTTVELDPQGADRYATTIPGAAVAAPALEYHLRATDDAGNEALHPDGAPAELHAITIELPDLDGPTIILDALPETVSAATPIPLAATITDPSGVERARLHLHSPLTGAWSTVDLVPEPDDRYTAVIAGALVVEPEVLVYLEAEDAEGNITLDPPEGQADPYAVLVEAEAEADPPIIVHSPAANGAQGQPLPITALVTDATGVAEVVLWYREAGADEWLDRDLTADGDRYSAQIPALATRGDAVEYYLAAADLVGNAAVDPADAPEAWYTVALIGEPDPDMGAGDPDMDIADPDMGAGDPDMTIEPGDDMGMVEAEFGVIPDTDAGTDQDDDEGTTGCACDAADSGAPAPLLALIALLTLARPRRRRG